MSSWAQSMSSFTPKRFIQWTPKLFVRPLDRAGEGLEVYRECRITGEEYSVEMMTDDFMLWRECGVLIQKALPYLNAEEREFLMTGINPTEWAEIWDRDFDDHG